MFSNVQAVNIANVGRKPLFNARSYEPQNFIKNSYAVKGNLQHPEGRTNYAPDDYRGLNTYYLA